MVNYIKIREKAWMNRAAPAPGTWQAFIGHCALRDPPGKHAFF
jgi:hypothetical protein